MKKLLLAGIVVLVVLLAFPIAVSAAVTVTVSGSIANTMSVSINLTNALLSTTPMVAGQTYINSSANLNTTTTAYNWNTKASDDRGFTKGYMNRTPFATLTNPFELSNGTGGYAPLTVDNNNFMVGTSAGVFNTTVYQRQQIVATDSQGAYSITITFTGYNP